jgi:4-hydroxybenzoate polyprenyltransferase
MIAYLKIIRPVNLLIIAFSQLLLREMVFVPLLNISGATVQLNWWQFSLLVLSSVLIAAGGYVINDINDTGMDSMNKPSKVIAGKIIPLSKAKNYYYGLNASGILMGIVLSYSIGKWELSILFIIISTMLYYYTYKYQYISFWGNFTVSLLAGTTIAIVWLFEFFAFRKEPGIFVEAFHSFRYINIFTAAYALFAFFTTLSREVIKDIQDREGDAKNGCRTLAVQYGETTSRSVAAIINLITVAGIAFFQAWLLGNNYLLLAYSLVIPQLLLVITSVLLFKTKDDQSFGFAGSLMKITMALGLITMMFVYVR